MLRVRGMCEYLNPASSVDKSGALFNKYIRGQYQLKPRKYKDQKYNKRLNFTGDSIQYEYRLAIKRICPVDTQRNDTKYTINFIFW